MKKWHAMGIACVLVLAGCQCFVRSDARRELDGFDPRLVKQPHPLFPNITLSETDKKIVLDQSPLRISKKAHAQADGTVTISWALPARSEYSFPKNGIQLGPVPSGDFTYTRDDRVTCDEGAQPPTSGDAAKQRSVPSAVAPQRPTGTVPETTAIPGISPFYITRVVLGKGYRTGKPVGKPDKPLCERREGLTKVFSCTFVAPEPGTIYKYSVHVCRGKELFDSYDPYVVADY